MPELARFYGILIRMYMEVGVPHNLPHFHAYYQGEQAVFSIDPVKIMMKHEFKKIVSVKVISPSTLELEFACGTWRRVDLSPVMVGSLFGELKNPEIFSQVFLDAEVGTVCWPNGADFDPDTLFNWDEAVRDLSQQLQSA